jgi:hypothetical protein
VILASPWPLWPALKQVSPKQELAALSYAAGAAEVFRRSDQNTVLGNSLLEFLAAERHRAARRYDEAEAGYLKALEVFRRHLGRRTRWS